MFWLFVPAEVVVLSSSTYLLHLLNCKVWGRIDGSIVQRAICLSWVKESHQNLEGALEEHQCALPVTLLRSFLAVLCSSLQPTVPTFSFLCHILFPGCIVPPCPFKFSISVQGFVFYFVSFSFIELRLVYWIVKGMWAQENSRDLGVSNQTGRKQNWRNCLFQHLQEVFVRGRIGTVSDVCIYYCFPKDVLCEIFFIEAAGRNIMKDFFAMRTIILKFQAFFLQWQLFVSFLYSLISHMFENISAGGPGFTNMAEL